MDAILSENRIFENDEALAHDVAEWLCGLAQASDRAFAVSLSGGSTPRRLYECLAAPEIASRFPWNRAHWFWGDERFVPHDHPDSNFRMARDAFLSRVPVPGGNIHAVPTEGLSPEQAAIAYETTLKRFYCAPTARSSTSRCLESERTDTPPHCSLVSRRCKKRDGGWSPSLARRPSPASR